MGFWESPHTPQEKRDTDNGRVAQRDEEKEAKEGEEEGIEGEGYDRETLTSRDAVSQACRSSVTGEETKLHAMR